MIKSIKISLFVFYKFPFSLQTLNVEVLLLLKNSTRQRVILCCFYVINKKNEAKDYNES